MSKLYILIGVPGSGKTTYAKIMLKHNANLRYVSRDEVRFSLVSEEEEYFSKETEVFNTFISNIKQYIDKKYDVIADATHISVASRKKLFDALGNKYLNKVSVIAVVFHPSLELNFIYNENRRGTRAYVPKNVIERMYAQFQNPTLKEYNGVFHKIQYMCSE